MKRIVGRLNKSKTWWDLFAGNILQAYICVSARHSPNLLIAGTDAGSSWVWDRPIYYDIDKNRNISLAEVEAWQASNSTPASQFEQYAKNWLPESFARQKVPPSWIQIYGIAYTRLIIMLVLWTVVFGGLFYVLKKKSNPYRKIKCPLPLKCCAGRKSLFVLLCNVLFLCTLNR